MVVATPLWTPRDADLAGGPSTPLAYTVYNIHCGEEVPSSPTVFKQVRSVYPVLYSSTVSLDFETTGSST